MRKKMDIPKVESLVCKTLQVHKDLLHTKSRFKPIVTAKHLTIYLSIKVYKHSRRALQDYYQNDHATILHALKKIHFQKKIYPDVQQLLRQILKTKYV